MEFDPEAGPDTRSDPLPELVELCADVEVEADVDAEDCAVVDVTVTVDVIWTVVPAPAEDAPPGGGRSGAPPDEVGALAPKAWVATKIDPAPARTIRMSTETTDSL